MARTTRLQESGAPLPILTVPLAEGARISGLSKSSLMRAHERGELDLVRVGGRVLVRVRDLERLLGISADREEP